MMDIGGGTIDISVYHRKCIRHTAIINQGSAYVTSDIAIGCAILMNEAETLKKRYGRAYRQLAEQEFNIAASKDSNPDIRYLREHSRAMLDGKSADPRYSVELARIIEMRLVELLETAWYEIKRSGHQEFLASGVVLTGGGSMIRGTAELAHRVFGVPVRVVSPMGIGGIRESVTTPVNATAVGLALYGAGQMIHTQQYNPPAYDGESLEQLTEEMERHPFQGVRRWIKEFFA
jgi:cell division protein FtsA